MIKAGEKVGQSECTLLNMLKVSPFTYGLVVEHGESSSLSYGDFIGYHVCAACIIVQQGISNISNYP